MYRNRRFIAGALIIVVAVGYLIYTSVRETSVYYLTIDEFLSRREAVAGEGVRVAGRVAADSMQWNASTLDLKFRFGSDELRQQPTDFDRRDGTFDLYPARPFTREEGEQIRLELRRCEGVLKP